MSKYESEIRVLEMPQGCILEKGGSKIVISSPKDAETISLSLIKMVQEQFPDYIPMDYDFSRIINSREEDGWMHGEDI